MTSVRTTSICNYSLSILVIRFAGFFIEVFSCDISENVSYNVSSS